jgi:hypothetical protein
VGGDMPSEFVKTGESWLRHNPGWEMKLWTEENLPTLRNQSLYDDAPRLVESRLLGRMRSNIARIELLHMFGGVYVDCDFVARKPIPKRYLDTDCFLPLERDPFVNNGLIGCVPGHAYMARIIEAMPESVKRQPGKPSNVTTGPHLLTRLLDDDVTIIPTEEVYPYAWQEALDGTGKVGRKAWAYHLWAGSRQQVSVIVPYREVNPERARSCEYVVGRLKAEHPDWQVTLQDSSGEKFSRAEAIVRGLYRSFGKIIVVHDSDSWCDGLNEAVARVAQGTKWAIPHGKVHRLDSDASERLLEGSEGILGPCHEKPYRGVPAGGIVVVARDAIEACPPDVRFQGWGGEDVAWGTALKSTVGEPWRGESPLLHIWHPPPERRTRASGSAENDALMFRYTRIGRRPSMMRRVVQEARRAADALGVD